MAELLIVDDSATDRKLVGRMLEKQTGHRIRYSEDGEAAMLAIRESRPDLVVSDLQMPRMNGLELVAAIRREWPSVPVILMTARGSEAIAAEALRVGATSYVPKSAIGAHFLDTVDQVLAGAQDERLHTRLMHSLVADECCFQLRNDPELIGPLVGHVHELLRCIRLEDQAERMRVSVAVRHALLIGYCHGNLEVPLDVTMSDETFEQFVIERERNAPWQDRSLTFQMSVSSSEAVFSVRHEGPPIDVTRLPANLDERASEASWLSGFVILPAIMDDVQFDTGKQGITLLKKACEPTADDDFEIGQG
ncbi:MAG: response regulator [Planctomycetaceae bacterium]